jgi:formylglycine-generating enzyme required for sulfatase activity
MKTGPYALAVMLVLTTVSGIGCGDDDLGAPVQPVGACCLEGVCSLTLEMDCAGTWYRAQSTCDPDPCAPSVNMSIIPAGTFTMGDGVALNGVVEREVTLTRDFYLGWYEVTNQEYMEALQWAYDQGFVRVGRDPRSNFICVLDVFREDSGALLSLRGSESEIQFDYGESKFFIRQAPSDWAVAAYPAGYDPANHPVMLISWFGAISYCNWISQIEGYSPAYNLEIWKCYESDPYGAEGYRLPTEAEWEYAAQFNDDRIYPWGDESPNIGRANYDKNVGWTVPVDSYPASPPNHGLDSMAGNVWEYCNDRISDLGTAPVTDPTGPEGGAFIKRGGGWMFGADHLRCATRSLSIGGIDGATTGFRVSRTVPVNQ